jgi:hypothetical protein
MPCDTRLKTNQTLTQRKEEVRAVVAKVQAAVASGAVRAVVDKRTGAVAFNGLLDADRDGVTDACIYRRVMATGSATVKAAIAKAEALAGRSVSLTALSAGHHSHDGGNTWHGGH